MEMADSNRARRQAQGAAENVPQGSLCRAISIKIVPTV